MDTINGRVKVWSEDRVRQAYKLALLGATDKQIADVMNININTLDYWKRTKPDFLRALNSGKIEADANIAESFYKRAHGFTFIETMVHMYKGKIITTKIAKYVIPDSWAANKWLSVRQRNTGIWADVKTIENINSNTVVHRLDLSGLTMQELMILKKAGLKQLTEHAGSSN